VNLSAETGGPTNKLAARQRARALSAIASVILLATCQVDRLSRPPPPLPALAVAPSQLLDSAAVGSIAPATATILVTNAAQGTLSWNARLAVGAPWLALSPARGTAPATLVISLVPTALTPGVYRDTVIVSADEATGSPVSVPVEFVVRPCVVTSITPDVQLSDSLTLRDCAAPHQVGGVARLYGVTTNGGDSISVVMSSAALDAYLVLDSSLAGTALPMAHATKLRYQLLPTAGTFVIEATTSAPAQTGPFTLSVTRPHAPNSPDSLNQSRADSVSAAPLGGVVDQTVVVLGATVSDVDSDSLRIEL